MFFAKKAERNLPALNSAELDLSDLEKEIKPMTAAESVEAMLTDAINAALYWEKQAALATETARQCRLEQKAMEAALKVFENGPKNSGEKRITDGTFPISGNVSRGDFDASGG
jgi:hypothetical protein